MENIESAQAPKVIPLLQRQRWVRLFIFALMVLGFWYLQYVYQYYVLVPGELAISLVRSFGLVGTMLIVSSLATSIVFKFVPHLAVHWRLR